MRKVGRYPINMTDDYLHDNVFAVANAIQGGHL